MKKQTPLQETTVPDYTKFGYSPTAKITITGELFNRTLELLTSLVQNEKKVYFKAMKDPEEMYAQPPMIYFTPEGMGLAQLIDYYFEVHVDNVNAGIATSFDELNKPQLSLVE